MSRAVREWQREQREAKQPSLEKQNRACRLDAQRDGFSRRSSNQPAVSRTIARSALKN